MKWKRSNVYLFETRTTRRISSRSESSTPRCLKNEAIRMIEMTICIAGDKLFMQPAHIKVLYIVFNLGSSFNKNFPWSLYNLFTGFLQQMVWRKKDWIKKPSQLIWFNIFYPDPTGICCFLMGLGRFVIVCLSFPIVLGCNSSCSED